jgi:hypothetical protein
MTTKNTKDKKNSSVTRDKLRVTGVAGAYGATSCGLQPADLVGAVAPLAED